MAAIALAASSGGIAALTVTGLLPVTFHGGKSSARLSAMASHCPAEPLPAAQWRMLTDDSGFELARIVPGDGINLIEARCA
jgi:hypothetical protein